VASGANTVAAASSWPKRSSLTRYLCRVQTAVAERSTAARQSSLYQLLKRQSKRSRPGCSLGPARGQACPNDTWARPVKSRRCRHLDLSIMTAKGALTALRAKRGLLRRRGQSTSAVLSAQRPCCIVSAVRTAVPTLPDYLFGLFFFQNRDDFDTHRHRAWQIWQRTHSER
jgi:hypothetical protein